MDETPRTSKTNRIFRSDFFVFVCFGLAGFILAILVACLYTQLPAPAPAPCNCASERSDLAEAERRNALCYEANITMATALEALAQREDGCAAFLSLPRTDPWIRYRMSHGH
jgi:hypothetical protein